MRSAVILVLSLLLLAACSDSDPVVPETDPPEDPPADDPLPLDSYWAMKQYLIDAVAIADVVEREQTLDALWDSLRAHTQIPFVVGDSVAFLYRGQATSIAFAGDFNGWSPANGPAEHLEGTDIWVREEVFPADSRLDYKIVRNGSIWMLDVENPRRQRSGFGDNSELPMPDYVPSPYAVRLAGVPMGAMTPGTLASTHLGYPVDYQVYTPVGYQGLDDLPVIYVTDGHEYADDLMGSMVIVLDNLIHEGLIQPIIAVFIDPRVNGNNLRADQYIMNQDFVDFVALELVPVIDAAWATSTDRVDRGILGTSLGGLNSAWFGLQATDTFYRIAIQSPAFQAGDGQIVDLYAAAPLLDLDIYMTWGTFFDFGPTTEQFQAVLDDKGYSYAHLVVNEGHSWGNWRALLDDVLIHFWPADESP